MYVDGGKLARNGQKTAILADGCERLPIDDEYAALSMQSLWADYIVMYLLIVTVCLISFCKITSKVDFLETKLNLGPLVPICSENLNLIHHLKACTRLPKN